MLYISLATPPLGYHDKFWGPQYKRKLLTRTSPEKGYYNAKGLEHLSYEKKHSKKS